MNLTSLHYFLELTKDLNMTKTAQRLYISTQALSYHIQRLEEEYKTPLFTRRPVFALTYAGKIVLAFAHQVEQANQDMMNHLADIKEEQEGEIRLGAGESRGRRLLRQVMGPFTARYPHVSVTCTDRYSKEKPAEYLADTLDLAIVVKERFDPVLEVRDFLREPVYLCIPEKLLETYYEEDEIITLKQKSVHGAQIIDFMRLPFIQLDNKLGRRIQMELISQNAMRPPFLICRYVAQALPLCLLSLAACYVPHMRIAENLTEFEQAQINVFPLVDQNGPFFQELSLIYHRERYQPAYTRYFINLLMETTHMSNKVKVDRCY